ncbi:MAG: FAD-dependent oxidoreductase, partial [Burkholderiales bacterium]|nr:FAD-dependent oxidoreductase [Burkholderiales bacterium]
GIQLGLRNTLEPPAYATNHVPLMEEQRRLLLPQPEGTRWFSFTVPTVDMPELAPSGGSVVEMFAAVDPARPLDEWNEKLAREQAQPTIDALRRHYPLDIAACRVVTPRDYERRMHLFGGALYGLSPGASPTMQFAHETPVHGLFQAGQTTHPGYGVGPALLSGILAAEAAARFLERRR